MIAVDKVVIQQLAPDYIRVSTYFVRLATPDGGVSSLAYVGKEYPEGRLGYRKEGDPDNYEMVFPNSSLIFGRLEFKVFYDGDTCSINVLDKLVKELGDE